MTQAVFVERGVADRLTGLFWRRPNLLLIIVTYLNVVGNTIFPVWLFQGLQLLQHVAIRDFVAKLSSMLLLSPFNTSNKK